MIVSANIAEPRAIDSTQGDVMQEASDAGQVLRSNERQARGASTQHQITKEK